MDRIKWYGPSLLLAATAVGVMAFGPEVARHIAWAQSDTKITLAKNELSENKSLAELSNAFRKVAQVVEPSVVSIVVSVKPKAKNMGPAGRGGGNGNDDLLRRWFGPRSMPNPDPEEEGGEGEEEMPDGMSPAPDGRNDSYSVPRVMGNGSGWVYDNLGHIITNNHVVQGADVITVRFHDGSEREAKIVGTDPKTDVAVIKVKPGDLHPASVAKEVVQQGDIVCAFGSPFRFEFSMSQGIVSAKGRQLGILDQRDRSGNRVSGYENFIQTDAAINPGNSGGPLTNIRGEVVGMNSAIASKTGMFSGLGFAIPVDMVTSVSDQLIKNGRVSRGYLGILIRDLDAKMAKTFKYTGKGVLVESPIEGGPGAKAGMQDGDIITHLDGNAIGSGEELRRYVAGIKPGAKIDVKVFRDGKPLDLTVTVVEQPDQLAQGGSSSPLPSGQVEKSAEVLRRAGIESARTLSEEFVARFKLKPGTTGVLVEAVRPDSAAAAAGILRGSIVTDVMGKPITKLDELVEQLEANGLSKGQSVRLRVVDPMGSRFVLLELPKE